VEERKLDLENYLNQVLAVKKLWGLPFLRQTLLPPPNREEDDFLERYFRDE
jgi:hypothetical protein